MQEDRRTPLLSVGCFWLVGWLVGCFCRHAQLCRVEGSWDFGNASYTENVEIYVGNILCDGCNATEGPWWMWPRRGKLGLCM